MLFVRDTMPRSTEVAQHSPGPAGVAQLPENEKPDETDHQKPGQRADQHEQELVRLLGLDDGVFGQGLSEFLEEFAVDGASGEVHPEL